MVYVIACGDEGVQLNEGKRLGVVGAGVKLPEFSEVVSALKEVCGEPLAIVASQENAWIKKEFALATSEQADATMQQQVAALADADGLAYAGFLPFADPVELAEGVKGHMVRPRGLHIANGISFTLAGGEQTFHLGHYVISAEWVHKNPELAQRVIKAQVAFYQTLAATPLKFFFEEAGDLGAEVAAANKAVLEKLGYKAE